MVVPQLLDLFFLPVVVKVVAGELMAHQVQEAL